MTMVALGPVQVHGEVLSNRRAGGYEHPTLVAPGVAARFRPGNLVAPAVGGALSDRLLRRGLPIYRARATAAYKSTVEVAFPAAEPGERWPAVLTLGGPAVLPVTLRCLWDVHAVLPDVPLVGSGGVVGRAHQPHDDPPGETP